MCYFDVKTIMIRKQNKDKVENKILIAKKKQNR